MQFKKALPAIGLGLTLIFGLAACSSSEEPPVKATTEKTTEKPTTTEKKEEPKESEEKENTDGVLVTFQALGEEQEDGEFSRFPVEFTVAIDSIEKMSESERTDLYKEAMEEQKTKFDAFDFYKIHYTETYVSGDDPKNQNFYTSYNPITSEGTLLNHVALIGYDWCTNKTINEDFVNGTPNVGCILGAVAKGEPAPAGIHFAQTGTDTDRSTGTPIEIYVK